MSEPELAIMILPVPNISSDAAASTARGLIHAFKEVLHARQNGRTSIYEGLVFRHYAKLAEIHIQFHGLLSPFDELLSDIERLLIAGDNAARQKLNLCSVRVKELAAIREQGKPQRRELYAHCQGIMRASILPDRKGDLLSEDERRLIRILMSAVCQYFECQGRYQHDFGNTVSGLTSLIEVWKNGDLEFSANSVGGARVAFGRVLDRMSEDWEHAAEQFSRVQMSLKFGLKVKAVAPTIMLVPDRLPIDIFPGRVAA